MATFYIKDGNDVFELSATTDVAISYNGSPTRFKVEDGSTISDHYVVENATCSFNGVITDIVSLNNKDTSTIKSSKEYIEGLRRIQLAKRTFTVFVDNKLQPFDSCVFTEIGLVKTAQEGLSGWAVTLGFEQIRIAERAKASLIKIDTTNANAESKDALSSKTDSGTTSTNTEELDRSLLRGTIDGVDSSVKNALGQSVGDRVIVDTTAGGG